MLKQQDKRETDVKAVTRRAPQSDFVMERFGTLRETDRSFDLEYWQRQGDAAIFQAAGELAELYHRGQGMELDELRFHRSLEHFQRS
jgi:aminoglycoside phosphotransferase (APT) family kinase protein